MLTSIIKHFEQTTDIAQCTKRFEQTSEQISKQILTIRKEA